MVDLIVIGAGPAGLFCAQRVAAAGLKVLVLEKNNRAGKKLLVAGSGKCNLTNKKPLEQFFLSYGKKSRFVSPCLRNFFSTDLISFFASHGLNLIELHAGKVFPETMRSSDVLKVLLSSCEKNNVKIIYDSPVIEIVQNREDGLVPFCVQSGSQKHNAKQVLISSGGTSWPVTGSTGDGYILAQKLGHTIIEPKPALTSVIPVSYDCARCAGFSLPKANIGLWREGKKIGERQGDVLFTHKGLSGPGILDFSRDFKPGDEISISLIRLEDSNADIDSQLLSLCAASPKKTIKNILSHLGLSEALSLVLLQRLGLDTSLIASMLDRKGRKSIALLLQGFKFIIESLGGFEEAMATSGGIDTSEVQGKTMESRLVSGLHFAGEVLDVDGDTGGYNLQFAFSSGALAADHIIKKAIPSPV